MVLLLTGRKVKAYIEDGGALLKVKLNIPDDVEAYENDIAERVSNFSDPAYRKEVLQEKFLRSIDDALTELLNTHQLPVILLASKTLSGHFKSISKNTVAIVDTITGNYEEATEAELKILLKPCIENHNKNRQ